MLVHVPCASRHVLSSRVDSNEWRKSREDFRIRLTEPQKPEKEGDAEGAEPPASDLFPIYPGWANGGWDPGNTADVREGLRTAQDRFTFDL